MTSVFDEEAVVQCTKLPVQLAPDRFGPIWMHRSERRTVIQYCKRLAWKLFDVEGYCFFVRAWAERFDHYVELRELDCLPTVQNGIKVVNSNVVVLKLQIIQGRRRFETEEAYVVIITAAEIRANPPLPLRQMEDLGQTGIARDVHTAEVISNE